MVDFCVQTSNIEAIYATKRGDNIGMRTFHFRLFLLNSMGNRAKFVSFKVNATEYRNSQAVIDFEATINIYISTELYLLQHDRYYILLSVNQRVLAACFRMPSVSKVYNLGVLYFILRRKRGQLGRTQPYTKPDV